MNISGLIRGFSSAIRTNHWWKYKTAHILGFTYFFFFLIVLTRFEAIILFILSTTTILGIAGMGYYLNDLYDIEFDLKAGKINRLAKIPLFFRVCIVVLLLILAFAPWFYLRSTPLTWVLIGFELFLFWVYAHPLTRLKEKAQWGLVCDALYGHALPVVIACYTYWQYYDHPVFNPYLFFLLLFFWQFIKGIRNILLHQLEDYENDIRVGIKTFTSINDINRVYRFVLYKIVPLEFVISALFLVFIFPLLPIPLLGFVLFLLIFVAAHGLFRNIQIDKEKYDANTYLYFLNDWYEDYLPVLILVGLVYEQIHLWPLLLGHFLIFPSAMMDITNDLKGAIKQCYFFLFDIKRWLGFEKKK